MKKIKRILKNTIEYFKSIRISTIYKIIGVLILLGTLYWIFSIINPNKKNENKQNIILTGTITNKGEDYIIIEDQTKNEYLIPGVESENYSIGSNVDANILEVIEEGEKEKKPTTITSDHINITAENQTTKTADEDIIAYLNETDNAFESTNMQEEIKIRFITIVDFLFYNGTIKGLTLNDLTTKTKLQVLKIALSIDNKMEKHFPGYKETITNTSGKIYTGIKNKIIESYLEITTKVCNYDKNLCESATNDFQEMKKAFSITWNVIRNLITTGTENLKEWYKIFSGKTN